MKNILLLLSSFGLVFFLIPNASLIGASLIIYFGILFLDFAFFSFFSEEILVFIEEQKILKRITFERLLDNIIFISLIGVIIGWMILQLLGGLWGTVELGLYIFSFSLLVFIIGLVIKLIKK